MDKYEHGSSDVVFILLVVVLVILVIIVFMNISQGTPFGERLTLTFGSIWTWILSFFEKVIAMFKGN
jgi:hypothetical protein